VLGGLSHEYDLAGRRVKLGGSFARTNLPQSVTSASYNAANHQTAFAAQTLTYDNNGNLVGDGTNTYTWNSRNQLVSFSNSMISGTFQYDASGRRISRTLNGITTIYQYDGYDVVREITSGAVTNLLTGALDEVLTRAESSGTVTPISDALGNVIGLTDSTGGVQTEYTYAPFGETTTSGQANTNPSQYTRRANDHTGLYYYRARQDRRY
jgi:YD repeat-containing protein